MRTSRIKISSILLIFLLVSFTQHQTTQISGNTACNTAASSPLVQTGTYSLTRQSNRVSRVNTFQIVVNYPIPSSGLTVTVSTSRINGYSQAVGTDYSIRASRVNQTNIVNFILLINHDISWASIQASFIFSSRSDLIVGSFYPNTESLFVSGSDTLVAQHQLVNWSPFSGNSTFALLLSGLRTADTFFNLNLTQANFVAQTGLFSFQVYTDALPALQTISLSYIILLGNAPFTFSEYNPLANTPSATYTFEGINGFLGNSIQYEGYALNFLAAAQSTIPCYGSNCPSTCIAPSRCSSLNGIVSFNQCFLCGFEELFSSNQCAPRCTGNQTWSGTSCVCRTGYTRVNGVCRIINCGPNESFNGIECICFPGFQRVNSVCRNITCPTNEVFNGTECVCLQGYQRINSFCQIVQCASNSFWNGQECICNQGFIKIGVSCFFQCGQNAYINETGSCVCLSGFIRNSQGQCVSSSSITCGSNQVFDSITGRCVCRDGTLFSRNQCLPRCTNFDNAVIFQGTCVCIEGFDVVNGFCVRQPTCTKQNEVVVNGACACRSGFQYNSLGFCIANCQANEVLVLQACQCVSGFFRNSFGICVRACSENQSLVSGVCRCLSGFVRLFNGTCARSCPANEFNSNGNCLCISTFSRNGQGICTKTCGLNEILQGTDCVCASGWARNSNGFCTIIVPVCRENEILNGNVCQCIAGYIRQGSICVNLCRVNEIYDTAIQGCICREGYGLTSSTGFCEICPPNSRSTGLLTGCVCITGYVWNTTTQRCEVIICQANASLSASGQCVCNSGFYLDGRECKRIVTCPARSTWDPVRLVCVCTVNGENLINGICQTCPANSGWNGTQCNCRSGFFPVGGSCQQCSPNSKFVQNQCVCNLGFFGTGLSCTACHPSCGTCINTSSTGCLTCANVSYTFSNGQCILRQCVSGSYFNQATQRCATCTIDYCASCSGDDNCDTCITGFQRQTFSLNGITFQSCQQICGDGTRFSQECDDGNKVNGDGCSSECSIESGWTCSGGSSTSKSNCINGSPTRTVLTTNGHVVLQGKVLQGMSLSYLPASLTANNCPQCNNILNVSVLSTPIIPIVSVLYVRITQFKFVITFDFGNILGAFVFNFTVRINPTFASSFTQTDMNQLQVIKIDMALLSAVDTRSALTLNNLQTSEAVVRSTTSKNTTSIVIPGVPEEAVLIMFGPDK